MQVIQKSVVKKITQNKNVNIEDFEWFVDAIKDVYCSDSENKHYVDYNCPHFLFDKLLKRMYNINIIKKVKQKYEKYRRSNSVRYCITRYL